MSVNLRVVPFPQSHCSAYQRKWQCQAVVSTFKHDTVISSFFSAVVRLWYLCIKQRQVWWCYSQFQPLQHQGCTCTCIHRAVDDRWSIPACTSLKGRCSEMIRCDLNNILGPLLVCSGRIRDTRAVFWGALWPGTCLVGRDETSAFPSHLWSPPAPHP